MPLVRSIMRAAPSASCDRAATRSGISPRRISFGRPPTREVTARQRPTARLSAKVLPGQCALRSRPQISSRCRKSVDAFRSGPRSRSIGWSASPGLGGVHRIDGGVGPTRYLPTGGVWSQRRLIPADGSRCRFRLWLSREIRAHWALSSTTRFICRYRRWTPPPARTCTRCAHGR